MTTPGLTTNQLTNQLLTELPRQFPDIVLWRQNTGRGLGLSLVKSAIQALLKGDHMTALRILRTRPIAFGVPGAADLNGFLAPHGRSVQIEVKNEATKDEISEQQIRFREMCLRMGAVHIEAHTLEQCAEELRLATHTGSCMSDHRSA